MPRGALRHREHHPNLSSHSRDSSVPPPSGGDIQRGDGGQRGVSVSTNWRWWRSNGTWTSGTGCRTGHGPWDSLWKDGTVVGGAEPYVPLPDARARLPGETSLRLLEQSRPSLLCHWRLTLPTGPRLILSDSPAEKTSSRDVLIAHFNRVPEFVCSLNPLNLPPANI